jgi:hypothetical protein
LRANGPGNRRPRFRERRKPYACYRRGGGAIAKVTAQGAITPGEAFKLSQTVDTFVRAIDTSDFDKRLQMWKMSIRRRPQPRPADMPFE